MNGPKVGVGALIIRDNLVLMHKRKGSHGAGTWSCPGGHLEFGESWEECARREVLEETGMQLTSATFITATNDIHAEEKHYITIWMRCEADGEPRNMEPDRCEGWEWFTWDELPQPLFIAMDNLLKQGYRP
jgi:8-oxo-dGTP diphosphatase